MKLTEYRRAQKLTLDAFGVLVGVSGEAVRKWEAQERIPRPAIMRRIERATGGAVTPADFYAQRPEPEQVAA